MGTGQTIKQPTDPHGRIHLGGPRGIKDPVKNFMAEHHGNYPDQRRYWQIWLGDIDYSSGKPQIKDQHIVLDNSKGEIKGAVLEPQNFRPGNEDELTVQSNHGGTEVMLLDLKNGEIVN